MYKSFRLSSALIQSIVLIGLQSWIILFYFNYTQSTIIYNKFKSYLGLYTSDFVAHSPIALLFMLSFSFPSKIKFSVLLNNIFSIVIFPNRKQWCTANLHRQPNFTFHKYIRALVLLLESEKKLVCPQQVIILNTSGQLPNKLESECQHQIGCSKNQIFVFQCYL